MEFDNNRPIYLQIADGIEERILSGGFTPGDRIPSVREWGATIGVNPNTVARSYDVLSERGIIENKRGIGFFVRADARESILALRRKEFIDTELPEFIRKAELLGIDLEIKFRNTTASVSKQPL